MNENIGRIRTLSRSRNRNFNAFESTDIIGGKIASRDQILQGNRGRHRLAVHESITRQGLQSGNELGSVLEHRLLFLPMRFQGKRDTDQDRKAGYQKNQKMPKLDGRFDISRRGELFLRIRAWALGRFGVSGLLKPIYFHNSL